MIAGLGQLSPIRDTQARSVFMHINDLRVHIIWHNLPATYKLNTMAKGRQLISLLYPFFLAALVLNCHGYEQQRKVKCLHLFITLHIRSLLAFSFKNYNTITVFVSGSCCVHGRSSKGRCISCFDTPQHASRGPWQVSHNSYKKERMGSS